MKYKKNIEQKKTFLQLFKRIGFILIDAIENALIAIGNVSAKFPTDIQMFSVYFLKNL